MNTFVKGFCEGIIGKEELIAFLQCNIDPSVKVGAFSMTSVGEIGNLTLNFAGKKYRLFFNNVELAVDGIDAPSVPATAKTQIMTWREIESIELITKIISHFGGWVQKAAMGNKAVHYESPYSQQAIDMIVA